MKSTSALPRGLSLHKAGTSIETVATNGGEVGLRVSARGVELIESRLETGDRLTLIPASSSEGTLEIYYLLEGSLDTGPLEADALGPGDIIMAHDLQETVTFAVEREVKFLCVTTQPTFHEVSGVIQDLKRLADEVELKDKGTAEHCGRVGSLALRMGKALGLSDDRLLRLDYGAYLHDIGKTELPLDILLKPTSLTPQEWKVIKEHPSHGRRMVENTPVKDIGPIIEQHHERFDGSGYPHGLAGGEVFTESYIVAVADAYDAMTTDRPYKRAMTRPEAVAEIERGGGRFYPHEVVQAFLASIKSID